MREWRVQASRVEINEDNAIVIAKEKEELFDLTYELDDIDLDGDVEEGKTEFVGFAEGRYRRRYKGISIEEINQTNGMSKQELADILANQSHADEEGRSLGMFVL